MTQKLSTKNIMALLGVAFVALFVFTAFTQTKATASDVCETPDAPANVQTVAMELELETGIVELELRPDLAPQHVARITSLAEQGFYDGIVFHRVIEGFMAQTGDPTGTGMGGSEEPDLPAEFTDTNYVCGTLGMARSQNPNSANSQFFITFEEVSSLNGEYTVFGYVKSGMEHVNQIKKGDRNNNGLVTNPDKIVSFRVKDQ